ncbi:hypothetical protein [Acidithiobacillus sp. IBUN Pt1247-S3]|uniref:hypothetical protein n=1 Tax=Acidithiobacillus sp. IBUN Pt1247-S3 TaxID=3166642 RepID=UPI0034E454F1
MGVQGLLILDSGGHNEGVHNAFTMDLQALQVLAFRVHIGRFFYSAAQIDA